jgi:subtilisin family serine protease
MRAALALLAGAALSLSAAPAAQASGPPEVPDGVRPTQTAPPVSDRVIVRWEAGSSRAERAEARAEVGAADSANLGKRFHLLGLPDGADAAAAVAELEKDPAVADAERDGYSVLQLNEPNDPLFNQLWGLDNKGLNIDGVASSTPGADIDALKAWGKTVGDNSVIVADLDDGIRPNHPDLTNRIWNNADEVAGDGIDNDGNGFIDDTFGMDFAGADIDALAFDNDPTDDIPQGGHGTHTAGTIAAEGNNGEGITGVAQKTTLMPLRVCGWSSVSQGVFCPFSSQIAGINYAGANGAQVANMSLGGTTGSTLVRDALAENPQVLYVIAAGNNGKDVELGGQTTFPCSWDPTTSGIPGAVDNVVCVAASDQNDLRASFSNWGRTKVDLAAPGTEILSTYPFATPLAEDFEAAGWPYAGWSDGGWVRSNAAPLSNWGITSTTNPAQADGTTRTTTTPTVSVLGPTRCRLTMDRIIQRSASDTANYKVYQDGVEIFTFNPTSSGVAFGEFNVDAGTHDIRASFSFTRSGGAATNGFSLARVGLSCNVPVGSETSSNYGFLQGTSMATPHVTGAAALLKAYEPGASTMQLKQALLSSVDPVAVFNPNSGLYPISTGGRLNADKALTAVDALIAPGTSITSAPSGSTSDTSATFAFTSDAKTPVTFECRVDGAAFAACSSPFQASGLAPGTHAFEVRAKDQPGNVDPTPATATWSVLQPPPPVQPVQPSVLPPAKVTGVTVKRSNKKAVIRWGAVPGATSYLVKVGKKSTSSPSTRFTLKRLKPRKAYRIQIIAVNSAGSSDPVNVRIKKAKKK